MKAIPKTKITSVDSEWRNPTYKYNSTGNSMWDLYNAFTHVNKGTFYADQIKRTQRLHEAFNLSVDEGNVGYI
jgi:hypothetical protein